MNFQIKVQVMKKTFYFKHDYELIIKKCIYYDKLKFEKIEQKNKTNNKKK